jgi:hypothetical protein
VKTMKKDIKIMPFQKIKSDEKIKAEILYISNKSRNKMGKR